MITDGNFYNLRLFPLSVKLTDHNPPWGRFWSRKIEKDLYQQ